MFASVTRAYIEEKTDTLYFDILKEKKATTPFSWKPTRWLISTAMENTKLAWRSLATLRTADHSRYRSQKDFTRCESSMFRPLIGSWLGFIQERQKIQSANHSTSAFPN
jgi:hypothetical protein